MSVTDLSDITEMLTWLIDTGIQALDGWPSATSSSVSPLPPDVLVSAGPDLALYLYHLAEDATFKNPAPNAGGPASRPLALNLYYQLTAQVGETTDSALRAQQLMGAAVRVLHNFPIITDSTTLTDVTGVAIPVLNQYNLDGRGNRLRITLRPVPVDDAVNYWTPGAAPLRLAAYYQVSVVLLDAEPDPSVVSRVLSYTSSAFATGAPILTGSSADLSIVVADADADDASTVKVQPAAVTLGERFELTGTSLSGTSTTLQLRDDRGSKTVDPGTWAVVASGTKVWATVSSAFGDEELIPGMWNASVIVTSTRSVGGTRRAVTHTSNETPIVIAPYLDPVQDDGPTLGTHARGDTITLTGWVFMDPNDYPDDPDDDVMPDIPTDPNDPRSVKLYVGGTLITIYNSASGHAMAAGEMVVTDPTTLDLILPTDLDPGYYPVRVIVRGASSAPQWMRLT